MNTSTFDIIIPTYQNPTELGFCLESLSKQTYKNFKVIVCIDGDDNLYSSFKEKKYPFEIEFHNHADKKRHGRNATRNLALKYISSNFILFLDSDITASEKLLENHLKTLSTKKCISQGHVKYLNTKDNKWACYLSSRGYNKFSNEEIIDIKYMNMGNVALNSEYIIECNGLNETFFHYGGDDTDLAIRLKEKYDLQLVSNSTAIGYSTMNKSLDFALEQMEEFGRFNLKYIYNTFTKNRNIYHTEVMNSNSFKGILFNLTFNPIFYDIGKIWANILPNTLANPIIHFLVVCRIKRGFQSKK